jgi:hypothetical protein
MNKSSKDAETINKGGPGSGRHAVSSEESANMSVKKSLWPSVSGNKK